MRVSQGGWVHKYVRSKIQSIYSMKKPSMGLEFFRSYDILGRVELKNTT